MRRKQKPPRSLNANATRVGYAFLAPALITFAVLVLFPVVVSLLLSFTKWNFFSGFQGLKFVGIDNFVNLFTKDRVFKSALVNTLVYAVATVPVTLFAALVLAHVMNGKVYFQRLFRTIFFVPYISSLVALGAVFKFLFRSDGPVNAILVSILHLPAAPDWLVNAELCKVPIICVMIYSGIGYCLIIYIAALKNVPRDLYEAAQIDGASPLQQFFRITVPMISPTTFYLLIVRMISAFQIFAVINIISDSGRNLGSVSLVSMIYEEAFRNYNFGYASAAAWVLVIIILAITLLNFALQKKWVHY